MKQLTQLIAAGGLAIPLMLLDWSGATGSLLRREHRATQQTNDREDSTSPPREARAIFEGKCATCHGKDGRAKTLKAKFNKARDLTDAAWQAEVSNERIYNSIANGRGRKMPAFAKKLSRVELEELAGYVRGLKK
jgi:mono/diheme cytochrome c family protein